ncbi:MAG: GntR family transcriptional regulator, partial [Clostridium sp.]|nr:GntR family transcriptional regulator [Clostridium sp.]
MKEKYTVPIYQKIALDLANKIHTGDIKEGSTLYGRSILAGKYNVSPETIRRAIKLLEDIDIVESIKGKGVTVLSSDNALSFIKKYEDITNISSYKSNLYRLLENKAKIDNDIILTLN